MQNYRWGSSQLNFMVPILFIYKKDYYSQVIDTDAHVTSGLTMGFKSNKTLLYSSDNIIKIYDIQNKKELNSLDGHTSRIKTLSISHDDQRIVSGAVSGAVMIHSLKLGTRSNLKTPFQQVKDKKMMIT